jgi:hypothetical protein
VSECNDTYVAIGGPDAILYDTVRSQYLAISADSCSEAEVERQAVLEWWLFLLPEHWPQGAALGTNDITYWEVGFVSPRMR